jgi:uncharacterized protein (TIGR02597 family)
MMKTSKKFIALLSGAALLASSAFAQTVATDPVGYVTVTVEANSDAVVSAVMARAASYSGTIASIDDADTITLSAIPGFTPDEFAPTDEFGNNSYYVQFTSGDREGLWAIISGNTSSALDLTFVNQDLGSVVDDQVLAGDAVAIIPFWTPATLYPDADVANLSELLVFSRTVAGINLSASATYVSFDTFGWYNGGTPVDNFPIYPDESMVFRNKSASPQQLTQAGTVPMAAFRTVLALVAGGTQQDIRLTSGLPLNVTLQEIADLGASGDGDQILIFDNTLTGENKSASITVTYFDGFGWYNGGTPMNSYALAPGQGIVYRKLGANTSDVVLNFKPTYQ